MEGCKWHSLLCSFVFSWGLRGGSEVVLRGYHFFAWGSGLVSLGHPAGQDQRARQKKSEMTPGFLDFRVSDHPGLDRVRPMDNLYETVTGNATFPK